MNNTWALSEALRPLVLNFHFQRGGKTVYVITGFTGFIGAITGMKPVRIYDIVNSSGTPIRGLIVNLMKRFSCLQKMTRVDTKIAEILTFVDFIKHCAVGTAAAIEYCNSCCTNKA